MAGQISPSGSLGKGNRGGRDAKAALGFRVLEVESQGVSEMELPLSLTSSADTSATLWRPSHQIVPGQVSPRQEGVWPKVTKASPCLHEATAFINLVTRKCGCCCPPATLDPCFFLRWMAQSESPELEPSTSGTLVCPECEGWKTVLVNSESEARSKQIWFRRPCDLD